MWLIYVRRENGRWDPPELGHAASLRLVRLIRTVEAPEGLVSGRRLSSVELTSPSSSERVVRGLDELNAKLFEVCESLDSVGSGFRTCLGGP